MFARHMHAITQARMVQAMTPFCKDLLLYLFVTACLFSIFQPQAVYSIWLAGVYESNESSHLTCLSRTTVPALANLTSPFHLSCQSADRTWRIRPIPSSCHSHWRVCCSHASRSLFLVQDPIPNLLVWDCFSAESLVFTLNGNVLPGDNVPKQG